MYPIKKILFVTALFVSSLGSAQEYQEHVERGRFRLGSDFGFGKSFVHGKIGDQEYTLKTDNDGLAQHVTIGPAFFADFLALDWLAVGVKYRMLFELSDTMFHDINGVIKFIFPQSGLFGSEYYLALPVGYSMITSKEKIFKNGGGFNMGLAFGGNYFLTNYFGFNFDIGYTFRRLNTELVAAAGKSKDKLSLNFHEFGANVGIVFRF